MGCVQLTLEGTKPIIGIKGLRRTSEYWLFEENEVLDGNNTISLTRCVLLNTLEKTCLITTILLSLHHDFLRKRRWWRIFIISYTGTEINTTIFPLTFCVIRINNQNRIYETLLS